MGKSRHYPIFEPSEDEKQIVVANDEGSKELFDILFYFDVPDTDRSYMVVTSAADDDDEGGDDDEQEVFAFRYREEGENYTLLPIETDEEWDMVEEMLNTFSEEE
ncbi:MAG: DUF1292 domain-containing protein [Sporolactobacillus sp.]|mgnify:CR=1 FL=1|jgi:uncharacterized protein YrzB (UPF0473 family)|nr:DUF1292 domain-containing protein [Sporolactobacillus sp.]MCI1882234.1 DUF1292 domain-containing protein [Sporolactobacillus sp.]